MTQGIILLAHGSRDPLWKLPIEAVAAQIAPLALVRCAYLEHTAPDALQVASDLIALGASSIRVFPLFLGIGKHARSDIPALMEQIAAQHPGVHLELLPIAGEQPQVTALLAQLALSP